MEKIRKYIENIKNFFNIGDIKAILFTLTIILALVIICQSSEVQASSTYTPVEYIQSNEGTEYIDTGIIPTTDTVVEIKMHDNGSVIAYERAFGVDGQFGIMRHGSNTTKWKAECGGSYDASSPFPLWVGYDTIIKMGKNIIEISDNEPVSYSRTPNTDKTIYIFHGNGTDQGGTFKLYYFKIWDNENLIRDFIPVLDSNNIPCLFDNITQELYYNQGSGSITAGEVIEDNTTNEIILELNVSTTEITQNFVTIYTQTFSEEFRNTHKCYYSYSNNEDGTKKWYLTDVSSNGYYYTYALENGTYIFRIEDLNGNTLHTASLTITNISSITDNQDNSVISPFLSVEPTSGGQVRIKTQTFSQELINNYRCFWWTSGESIDNKKEALPNKISDNNYYFSTVTNENNTFYFVLYDIEKNKYSEIVSLTVDVQTVLTDPTYGAKKTMSELLKQKFGVFFNFTDYMKEFWNIVTADNPEPPNFEFTMPEFLGGGSFNIFNIEIFDKYRQYVHYILAGFIYFYYIKKMTKVIPAMISDIAN